VFLGKKKSLPEMRRSTLPWDLILSSKSDALVSSVLNMLLKNLNVQVEDDVFFGLDPKTLRKYKKRTCCIP